MQTAVRELAKLPPSSLNDQLSPDEIDRVVALLDQMSGEVSCDDAKALLRLLPESDDDLFGVNWSILHAIEAAASWPNWHALDEKTGWWSDLLRMRCANAGIFPPA